MNSLIRALRLVTIAVLCTLASACMTLKHGTPLITEGLHSLKLGQSTYADILLALGQPRGNGSVRVSQSPEPHDILFYEFMESDLKNVEFEILLVFMVDQIYDGYLWFASTDRVRQKGGIPFLTANTVMIGYFPETANHR